MFSFPFRKACSLIILTVFGFCPAQMSLCGESTPPAAARMTQIGIELINGFDFDAADEVCAELKEYPDGELYSSFLRMYKYYWRFRLSPHDGSPMLRDAVNHTINLCENGEFNHLPEAGLFGLSACIFRSMIESHEGNHINALYWLGRGMCGMDDAEAEEYFQADLQFVRGCREYYGSDSDAGSSLAKFREASMNGFYFRDIASFIEAEILESGADESEKAVRIYRELRDKYDGNTVIGYYLAKSLQHRGLYRRSIEVYRNTLSTITYNPLPLELLCSIHFSMAQIYEYNLMDYKSAAACYEAAFHLADPSIEETRWYIPWSSLHLGAVFSKMNDIESASRWLGMVRREDDAEAFSKAAEIIEMLLGGSR